MMSKKSDKNQQVHGQYNEELAQDMSSKKKDMNNEEFAQDMGAKKMDKYNAKKDNSCYSQQNDMEFASENQDGMNK